MPSDLPIEPGGECGCGEPDCMHLFFGYPFCAGIDCDQHHRAPVAKPGERCPVDVNGELYDRLEAGGTVEDHEWVGG